MAYTTINQPDLSQDEKYHLWHYENQNRFMSHLGDNGQRCHHIQSLSSF